MTQYRYKIIDFLVGIGERIASRYLTIHIRPMYSEKVIVDPGDIRDYSEYAIVIQGPILSKNNFTLETARLYKKYFPNALIILSTWEGEDAYCISQAKKEGIEVLVNKKYAQPGPLNINLQLISSGAGIQRAIAAHKKYTLKVRTDIRIYNYNSLLFLTHLLKLFPITDSGGKQKGRLISTHGRIKKWYYFPDQLVFGYTEDVAVYFGAGLLSYDPGIVLDGSSRLPFCNEQYLFTEFLKKTGYPIGYTYEDSLRTQAKRGLIMDAASLDWYWHKYKRYYEERKLLYLPKKQFLDFSQWLNLYDHYDILKK